MLRVAICDSDENCRRQTANIIFYALFDMEDVVFSFYDSGSALTDALLQGTFQADLLISEILFADINGLRLMKLIRMNNIQCEVILQSDALEMAQYGYRYHVFDFVRKSEQLIELEHAINRFSLEKLKAEDGFLSFSIQGTEQRLRMEQIQFFESHGRKVTAILEHDRVEFYEKLNELHKRLPISDFIRCHQSYIVNRNYIAGYSSGELILLNRNRVPVSRKYMDVVKNEIRQ